MLVVSPWSYSVHPKVGGTRGAGVVVNPYPHTLSQSFFTSASAKGLHCVSCSIQPSISCSIRIMRLPRNLTEKGSKWGGGGVIRRYKSSVAVQSTVSHGHISFDSLFGISRRRVRFWSLFSTMSQLAIDPNSAVYTTDEVWIFYFLKFCLISQIVWATIHYSSRTSKEDESSWIRGDQGLLRHLNNLCSTKIYTSRISSQRKLWPTSSEHH